MKTHQKLTGASSSWREWQASNSSRSSACNWCRISSASTSCRFCSAGISWRHWSPFNSDFCWKYGGESFLLPISSEEQAFRRRAQRLKRKTVKVSRLQIIRSAMILSRRMTPMLILRLAERSWRDESVGRDRSDPRFVDVTWEDATEADWRNWEVELVEEIRVDKWTGSAPLASVVRMTCTYAVGVALVPPAVHPLSPR